MVNYMPIKWDISKDRWQRVNTHRKLTEEDIVSFTEGDYTIHRLLSGDIMFYGTAFQEAKVSFHRNDIASAIAGFDVFGPVLTAEKRDVSSDVL